MILLWCSAAVAGVPLVYDGGGVDEVVAFAVDRTGLPASQFDPVALDSLLTLPPRTLGPATLRACAGAPTRAADLAGNAVRAEARWRDQDAQGAMDQLDLGIASVGCLGDRVEPDVVSGLFLLRGGLLAAAGDLEGARAEVRTALSLAPAAAWGASLPEEGRAIFDAVRAETATVLLTVSPATGGARPAVDGKTAPEEPVPLRSGLHLVQLPSTSGLRSAWLTVAGDATLVLPGSYRRPVLERMSDEAARVDVERLLLATSNGGPVYVTSQGGLWLVSAEGTTTLGAPTVPTKGRR